MDQKQLNQASKMKKQAGYTLIELILVISIMGVLFTALYRPVETFEFQIEKEIEAIAADLRWARKKAILDDTVYIFRIYTLKEAESENKIPYYFYIKEDGIKIIKKKGYYSSNLILYKTLSHKLVEADYYEWIRFNNTATARGGTIALARANDSSKKYSITVNQLGRVRIEK